MAIDEKKHGKNKKPKAKKPEPKKLTTLKVLNIVISSQLLHGLRHNDYKLYRQYCTRRIRRLRKAFKSTQGVKVYKKKEITSQQVVDARILYIPLAIIERCWAHAMELKEESLEEPRKKFAMRNKLRKATKEADAFLKLVTSWKNCDDRTHLEVEGYCAWIQGTAFFEMAESTEQWETTVEYFTKSQTIYKNLLLTVTDAEQAMYKERLQDLEVKLRYCRHHLGDRAATDKLLEMRSDVSLGSKLDKLLEAAHESEASTLSEVKWKGQTIMVKDEKVRLFLLNENLIQESLCKNDESPDQKVEVFDKLLMECKDAILIVREQLNKEPNFKTRQQANEGPVSNLHFLYSYLIYLRIQLTCLRNLELYHQYHDILKNKRPLEEGKKMPKYQDLVRICDLSLQNLAEMSTLAGLEQDAAHKKSVETQKTVFKAHRCFSVAETFAKQEKWPEALALFTRTTNFIDNVDEKQLPAKLLQNMVILKIESEKNVLFSHAQLLLSQNKTEDETFTNPDKKRLVDRLDVYFEDPSLTSRRPLVAPVPPDLTSAPCKPLFFDLALNHVEFPSLDDKDGSTEQNRVGGIRGLVKGLWGWGGI